MNRVMLLPETSCKQPARPGWILCEPRSALVKQVHLVWLIYSIAALAGCAYQGVQIAEPIAWHSSCSAAGVNRAAVLDDISHVADVPQSWVLLRDSDMLFVAHSYGPGVRVDWRPELVLRLPRLAAEVGSRDLRVNAAYVFDRPKGRNDRLYFLIRGTGKHHKYGWLHVLSTSERTVCSEARTLGVQRLVEEVLIQDADLKRYRPASPFAAHVAGALLVSYGAVGFTATPYAALAAPCEYLPTSVPDGYENSKTAPS
jgi:hypothetical protein